MSKQRSTVASRFFDRLIDKHPKLGHSILFGTTCTAIIVHTIPLGIAIWGVGVAGMLSPSHRFDRMAVSIAKRWINNNNILINHILPPIEFHISLPSELTTHGRYILVCNHQSWVDTLLMQYVSEKTLPLTRFFTKWELIYIPFVGQAFYFLGFPMMKRLPKSVIAKNPKLKDRDIEEARRACRKIKHTSYTLLNYIEGTRFTLDKRDKQGSPYRHLLKPKAGGLALAFEALGQQMDGLLDMTIVYPDGIPSYDDFWKGKVRRIGIDIRMVEVPDELLNAGYYTRPGVKAKFYGWLDKLWQHKDKQIDKMLSEFGIETPIVNHLSDKTHKPIDHVNLVSDTQISNQDK